MRITLVISEHHIRKNSVPKSVVNPTQLTNIDI